MTTATIKPGIAPAAELHPGSLTFGEAVNFLNAHEHSPHLLAVETFFLKRLMEDLEPEEKAECYYYLLRCRLKKSRLFETVDSVELYKKMRAAFAKAEKELLTAARRGRSRVARAQLAAFYRLAIFHFGSLENIYRAQNFEDSMRQAYEDKMDLRRRSFRFDGHYASWLGYLLTGTTSRYGNSFVRWGLTTLLSLVGFVLVYASIDAASVPEMRIIPLDGSFFKYFYYTIVTFTTLGYGDLHPHTMPQMAAVCVEVLVGYFMLGVLINLLNRRM